MPDELKPCPFCGHKPKIYKDLHKFVDIKEPVQIWRVMCSKLDCVLLMSDFRTEEQAIEAWNRRAGDEGAVTV